MQQRKILAGRNGAAQIHQATVVVRQAEKLRAGDDWRAGSQFEAVTHSGKGLVIRGKCPASAINGEVQAQVALRVE